MCLLFLFSCVCSCVVHVLLFVSSGVVDDVFLSCSCAFVFVSFLCGYCVLL